MTAVRAKRKVKVHAESCSDVEVVETDAQQTRVASSSRKKEKIEHGARFVGSGIECLFAFPQDESLHFVEFGRPRLLIQTEHTQHSTGDERSLASGHSFPRDEASIPNSAPHSAADLGASARSWQSSLPQTVTHEPPSASGDIALDQCLLVPPHNPTATPRQSKSEGLTDCDAFSDLMSSRKANRTKHGRKPRWLGTAASAQQKRTVGGNAPFYKVMQSMPIAVDAFCYGAIPGVTSYFLTPLYESFVDLAGRSDLLLRFAEGTANLIIHMLSVDPKWVHPLPMDVPTMVPNSGGVTVTLIEAKFCLWSSLFFHCGDFRASPQHTLHPAVKDKRIDITYLDTTYLNPRVISACAELSKRLVSGKGSAEDDKGTVSKCFTLIPKLEAKGDIKLANTLILVGTYFIGKERIVKAIAKALDSKMYCDQRKAAILRCQSDPELHRMLTADPFSANVHLVPLNVATSDRLKEYMGRWNGHWTKAVAFRPTGWTYSPPAGTSSTPSVGSTLARPPHREFTHADLRPARGSTPSAQLFGVPYSEHSSFFELTCLALSLDWARIVPTVNVESAASRAKISTWIARWEAERRKRPLGVVPLYRSPEYW
ncbi:DNA repair metallo-beta-lactamase-domain-containing protein [Lactarius pseudohatsudake]|nr:DNA repair metallo-beta-lactamase-domain-containing protein [Lactarius pseudohatsudake]